MGVEARHTWESNRFRRIYWKKVAVNTINQYLVTISAIFALL